MALTRRHSHTPFGDLWEWQRELTRNVNRMFGTGMPDLIAGQGAWAPFTDIFNRGDDVVIRAELPGVKPEDVDISISDHMLTISGERRMDQTIQREDYYSSEICYGAFEKTISVPEGVKTEDIKASYENGILEVVLPNASAEIPERKVKIDVKVA